MDINGILRGVDCSCGKRHECDIEAVYIENGAISRLADLCKNDKKILIVADENTYGAAGKKVESALCDKELAVSLMNTQHSLHMQICILLLEDTLYASGNGPLYGRLCLNRCGYDTWWNEGNRSCRASTCDNCRHRGASQCAY